MIKEYDIIIDHHEGYKYHASDKGIQWKHIITCEL